MEESKKMRRLTDLANEHLREGEIVHSKVLGMLDGHFDGEWVVQNGIFLSTNERLLFCNKKHVYSMIYEDISNVEFVESKINSPTIKFQYKNEKVSAKYVEQGDVQGFLNHLTSEQNEESENKDAVTEPQKEEKVQEKKIVDRKNTSEPAKKKPVYKRWWFWVTAAIVAIGVIGNMPGETETQETTAVSDESAESEEKDAAEENKQEESDTENKSSTSEKNTAKDEVKTKEENTEPSNETMPWEDKIKEVAANDGSETEKYDEIMSYAGDYKATDKERMEFEVYIIEEYTSGNYLSDVTDHEYMLENIFKARVVDKHFANTGENSAMSDFAFDFLQIAKYTYRGVEEVNSDFVKENEYQLDKSLEEM